MYESMSLSVFGAYDKKRLPNIKIQNLLMIKLLFLLYSEVEHTDPLFSLLSWWLNYVTVLNNQSSVHDQWRPFESNPIFDEANKCICNTCGLFQRAIFAVRCLVYNHKTKFQFCCHLLAHVNSNLHEDIGSISVLVYGQKNNLFYDYRRNSYRYRMTWAWVAIWWPIFHLWVNY